MTAPLIDLYLTHGNIAIFCGAHSDEFKNDILHSSLYGQLVAESPSHKPHSTWAKYTNTLEALGWITNRRESRHFKRAASSLFKMLEYTAGQSLPNVEQQALTQALSELQKLPRDSVPIQRIINTLQARSSVISDGSQEPLEKSTRLTVIAQLTIVCRDKTVVTLRVSLEATNVLDIRILDQPILNTGQDTTTNIWSLSSFLDEGAYPKFRDTIIKKLGSKIGTDLFHIREHAIVDGDDELPLDV